MKKNNFILGKGELLVKKAPPKKFSGGPTSEVYTYEEAAERLKRQLNSLLDYIDDLPDQAKPQSKIIFSLFMHPQFIAKSYFPNSILKYFSATTVGSKPAQIKPEKQLGDKNKSNTNQFFILATEENIKMLTNTIEELEQKNHKQDIQRIERISAFTENEKTKFLDDDNTEYEILLHASDKPEDSFILRELNTYSKSIENKISRIFIDSIDGLTFIHTKLNKDKLLDLAKYTFIRAIRKAPKIREISLNSVLPSKSEELEFNDSYIDNSISVAIFDGGFKEESILTKYVDYENLSKVSNDRYIEHGIGVTSACLFGHINGKELTPYSRIKNYRVLDDDCSTYEILERIEGVLKYEDIEFINLSIGPNKEIEDDDVHYWTAKLDKYFSTGEYFACIAAGNNNSRVQVPSDCVNAMTIGSANDDGFIWNKAYYSNVGPGRVPGFIKPDGIAFGGDSKAGKMFKKFNADSKIDEAQGTSFASPSVLRSAIGIKSLYDKNLQPITLKGILIHHAEKIKSENQTTVGWGRFNLDVDDMMTCHDHQVKVIYQGKIAVKEYYRASIPFPDNLTSGDVNIKATFCFNSTTDAEHPPSYTNYGLVATFIPNSEKKTKTKNNEEGSNATDPFFSPSKMYESESDLRTDSQKWETVLHSEKVKRISSLKDPYFEIKYHERENGADSNEKGELSYALIVTVESKSREDIYSYIQTKYPQLVQVKSQVQVSI